MSDTLYDDLPEDAEEAFILLEQRFRADRDRKVGPFDPDQWFPADQYLEYMRRTASAAQELELNFFSELRVPSIGNLSWDSYRVFQSELEHYLTSLQIRRARRDGRYVVRFDAKTKLVITHHINQIREIILRLEVDDWKREALINRLSDLQMEVDKDRFRYQVLAAFSIEAAGVIGEVAEKMEPVRKFVDSLAGLIWGNKQAEQTKSLPPPSSQKRISPPQRVETSRSIGRITTPDDEIPF